MSTRSTVETWLEKFNAGDHEGISALYADDAIDHQIPLAPVVGDWAALEWTDPDGFRGCGFFLVRDGLIVHQRGYWDSAQLAEIHPNLHGD